MKKNIIVLGGLISTIMPIVSAVSCNNKNNQNNNYLALNNKDSLSIKQKNNFVSKAIKSYLEIPKNKNYLLNCLNVARKNSKNLVELKTNLISNIANSMLLDFNGKNAGNMYEFAVISVKKSIMDQHLYFTSKTPKSNFKQRGTYGIVWHEKTKQTVILEKYNSNYIKANSGAKFWGRVDDALKANGLIKLAIGVLNNLDPNEKIGNIIKKVINFLNNKKILNSKIIDKLKKIENLNISIKELQDALKNVESVIHNVDYDLVSILKSKDKLNSILKVLQKPNVILNKAVYYKGVKKFINIFADLAYKNNGQITDVLDLIVALKPNLIKKDFQNLIIKITKTTFFKKALYLLKDIDLKKIKIVESVVLKIAKNLDEDKVKKIKKIILNIVKNNDLSSFNIIKFITNKENISNLNELVIISGLSYSEIFKLVIDNFDFIKPLFPFIQPVKDKSGNIIEDKYKSLSTQSIYKLINIFKVGKDNKLLKSNSEIIKNILSLSFGELVSKITDSGALSTWFYQFMVKLELFKKNSLGHATLEIVKGWFGSDYDNKPLLSYDFFSSLEKFLNTWRWVLWRKTPMDKLPKEIQVKLKLFFKYFDTLKTSKQKQTFTKELQDGMKNGLKLLLNKNSPKQSKQLLNNILSNSTFNALLNLLK